VDVYYCGEDAPEKAIVKVELPGSIWTRSISRSAAAPR
jgi:hypothetical protein